MSNISLSLSSFMILAASFFLDVMQKTDIQTNGTENQTPTISVGVGNYYKSVASSSETTYRIVAVSVVYHPAIAEQFCSLGRTFGVLHRLDDSHQRNVAACWTAVSPHATVTHCRRLKCKETSPQETNSTDVDPTATSTAVCDLDHWPPKSNQVISRASGYSL